MVNQFIRMKANVFHDILFIPCFTFNVVYIHIDVMLCCYAMIYNTIQYNTMQCNVT